MIELTSQERASAVWFKVQMGLKDDLENLRKQLEGAKDHDETNVLRGRIQQIRAILQASEESPKQIETLVSF